MIMEYQKIIKLLDNTSNQPSTLRTKNWVEINDESRRTYMLVKWTITPNKAAADADANNDANK